MSCQKWTCCCISHLLMPTWKGSTAVPIYSPWSLSLPLLLEWMSNWWIQVSGSQPTHWSTLLTHLVYFSGLTERPWPQSNWNVAAGLALMATEHWVTCCACSFSPSCTRIRLINCPLGCVATRALHNEEGSFPLTINFFKNFHLQLDKTFSLGKIWMLVTGKKTHWNRTLGRRNFRFNSSAILSEKCSHSEQVLTLTPFTRVL